MTSVKEIAEMSVVPYMSTEPGEAQPPGNSIQPSVARQTTTFAVRNIAPFIKLYAYF